VKQYRMPALVVLLDRLPTWWSYSCPAASDAHRFPMRRNGKSSGIAPHEIQEHD
jgi:hypothetical protein